MTLKGLYFTEEVCDSSGQMMEVRMLSRQLEEEMQKKDNLQNDLSHHLSQINQLKGTEKRLLEDLQHLKKMLEKEALGGPTTYPTGIRASTLKTHLPFTASHKHFPFLSHNLLRCFILLPLNNSQPMLTLLPT